MVDALNPTEINALPVCLPAGAQQPINGRKVS
jgi:hypothetical protein